LQIAAMTKARQQHEQYLQEERQHWEQVRQDQQKERVDWQEEHRQWMEAISTMTKANFDSSNNNKSQ
jgi:hypothetical protein